MREIKFRAWDIENKKWLKDWSSYKAGGSEQYFVGFNGDLGCHRTIVGLPMPMFDIDDEPDGIILEQYTGLKDKNGKEIYEGDIVHTKFVGVDPEVWVIGWDISLCRFGYFYSLERVLQGHWSDHDFKAVDYRKQPVEIIGNIHENPELLEGN